MILIITSKNDSHADAAIRLFTATGKDVFRLNTEDFLTKYAVNITLRSNGQWNGVISDEVGRHLHLEDLRAAWFRKPTYISSDSAANFDEGAATFVVAEAKSTLDIIYSLPQVTWINDPFRAHRAKVKFQQLILASELGMKTPQTLITTNPADARQFASDCNESGVLTKAIYTSNVEMDGMNYGILSRRVSPSELANHAESIRYCPTQLQEYCEKAYELRVTVVASHVFAVRIDSQTHTETQIDWRADTYLSPHSVYELPPHVETFCRLFMARQQLVFGAMDFIVTRDGEYVFLENNPYGNYEWLETVTSVPITRTLVDVLCELDCGGSLQAE